MTADDCRLIAYPLSGAMPDVRPARPGRDWMDTMPEQFAYRCLPLNMANMYGWEVCTPYRITANWDSGPGREAIQVSGDGPPESLPVSHFGQGILTFHVTVLLRTPPGINMLVTGPLNHPKDGIYGLSGIIETDWSPYSFTMNWKFTTAGLDVVWEAGEPFATLIPIQRGLVEGLEPEVRDLDTDPQTAQHYRSWTASRETFNHDLADPASEAAKERWQKGYYRGLMPDGSAGHPDHQIKARVKPFPGAK